MSHITTAPGPPDSPREPDTVCRSAAAINVSWEVSQVLCFQLLNIQLCKMGHSLCQEIVADIGICGNDFFVLSSQVCKYFSSYLLNYF